MSGFIKLRRSLVEWEWYDDHNATRLLIHLLISVNYKDKKWKGLTVKKGSMVLSWGTLAKGCGLSVRQCRTAMDKLIDSGEVTKQVTNKFQVVSLVKWEKMQIENISVTGKAADKRQTDDNQMTTTKEREERKKVNKASKEAIPAMEEFFEYALEKKPNVCMEALKLKYESWVENGWKTGGNKPKEIKRWKSTLLNTLPYMKEAGAGAKSAQTIFLQNRYNYGNS